MVGDAEVRAEYVLDANWDSVRETAEALLEHETLSGVALDAVLSPVQPIKMSRLTTIVRNGNSNGHGGRRDSDEDPERSEHEA